MTAIWYHGTSRQFRMFEHGHSQRYDWNAHLGVHFADRPEPANIALRKDRHTSLPDEGNHIARAVLVGRVEHVGSEGLLAARAVTLAWAAGWFKQPGQVVPLHEMDLFRRNSHLRHLSESTRERRYAPIQTALEHGDSGPLEHDDGCAALNILEMQLGVLPPATYVRAIRQLAEYLRQDLSNAGICAVTYDNAVEGGIGAAVIDLSAVRDPYDPDRPWSNPWTRS